ncbi:viral methyltransferase-domain-containing protein [Parasitella parasitica]|nr:viral methyltransferase-domain-containing protein [Parasitella parasitica]
MSFAQELEDDKVATQHLRPLVQAELERLGLPNASTDEYTAAFISDPEGPISAFVKNAVLLAQQQSPFSEKKASNYQFDVRVPYRLTTQQQELLCQAFSDAKHTYGTRGANHSLAAASRLIWTDLIMRRIPTSATIIDVGGNFSTNVSRGWFHVHSCVPRSTRRDAARFVEQEQKLRSRLNAATRTARVVQQYFDEPTRFCCSKRAQECSVQATVMLSFHSAYDITL